MKIGAALLDPHDPNISVSKPLSETVVTCVEKAHTSDEHADIPTAIDELMATLTRDVVGYISYRLNSTLDGEPPRIVDVDVIHKLARDVIARTCADVEQADRGRVYADKCIEAYIYVGEIEAWLKRNAHAKNKEVFTSLSNLKQLMQAA